MKKLNTTFFLSILTVILLAQNPARTGKDYAYLFYVTDFNDKSWTSLPEAKNEVEAIAWELSNNYGFEVKLYGNPTKENIEQVLLETNKQSYSTDDQILFFFSSHGYYIEAEDRGYFIPKNAEPIADDPLLKSWLSYDDLGSYITRISCNHILVSLDACYSGSFGDRWKSKPAGLDGGTDCYSLEEKLLSSDSRLYFTSGSKNQKTPAKSKFAEAWIRALQDGKDRLTSTNHLNFYFGEIDYPQPERGTFTKKDKGGDFIFMHKSACKGMSEMPAITPSGFVDSNQNQPDIQSDKAHWDSVVSSFFSRNLLLDHIRLYKSCQHEKEALNKLSQPVSNMVHIDMTEELDAVSFYIGKFEVTFREFDEFCASTKRNMPNDNSWGRGDRPVININWFDAIEYCNWKSERESLTKAYLLSGDEIIVNRNAEGYRLPTVWEWERASSSSKVWSGTNILDSLYLYSNYSGIDDGYRFTAPVGSFFGNENTIYDMSGNVYEWCWDEIEKNEGSQSEKEERIIKGGAWNFGPTYLKTDFEKAIPPESKNIFTGFRLCRTAK